MASFLTPVSGYNVPSPETRSKESVISLPNNWYTTRIYNKPAKASDLKIQIEGYTPPQVQIALNANWDSPFGGTSISEMAGNVTGNSTIQGAGQIIDKTAKFGGATTRAKIMTAMTWTEPEYLELTLPISLKAYASTEDEVKTPLRDYLKTVAPYTAGKSGILLAPGPAPAEQVLKDVLNQDKPDMNANTGAFVVEIGSWFRMYPAVIRSVTVDIDGKCEDGSGNPISADVQISVSSYYAVTREDLDNWMPEGGL